MKSYIFCALMLVGSVAVASGADKTHMMMDKACAPLFAAGGACADLSKGTRNCVRQNLADGGAKCAAFEKAHKKFFDAGKNDPIVHKKSM